MSRQEHSRVLGFRPLALSRIPITNALVMMRVRLPSDFPFLIGNNGRSSQYRVTHRPNRNSGNSCEIVLRGKWAGPESKLTDVYQFAQTVLQKQQQQQNPKRQSRRRPRKRPPSPKVTEPSLKTHGKGSVNVKGKGVTRKALKNRRDAQGT